MRSGYRDTGAKVVHLYAVELRSVRRSSFWDGFVTGAGLVAFVVLALFGAGCSGVPHA